MRLRIHRALNLQKTRMETAIMQTMCGSQSGLFSRSIKPISEGTESFLVRRITRANVRRRQQFAYWKKHRDKLTHHTRIFTQHVEAPKEATPIPVHVETQVREVLIPIIAPQSVTTATRLNIQQLAARDDQSTISVSEYAPSTHYSREIVNFPPAPKQQSNEKFFECPYCFTLCPTALLAKKAWK